MPSDVWLEAPSGSVVEDGVEQGKTRSRDMNLEVRSNSRRQRWPGPANGTSTKEGKEKIIPERLLHL